MLFDSQGLSSFISSLTSVLSVPQGSQIICGKSHNIFFCVKLFSKCLTVLLNCLLLREILDDLILSERASFYTLRYHGNLR